ncbi:MAG: class I SAM-dependent methyltransferase [Desulfobacteraceae bacterium]|nr:class I SAM-dependent methyltransferase [Desulfobacteraceae bacterium]
MSIPYIDWNGLWREVHAAKRVPMRDPKYWDKRAVEFARHASSSGYVGQFLEIMKPEPNWSVLDVGCAAGTLSVPLAPLVRSITAMDSSPAMLGLLDERCRKEGIGNIRPVKCGWEDDWDAFGIGDHDVAIASRSLIVDDLRGGILKLQSRARKRVYLSTLVDDGPHDRKIVEAVGRTFRSGPDYIIVYNLLRQMGVYANVAFTINREEKIFSGIKEAEKAVRWMLHAMTPEEETRLRNHLAGCLIRCDGGWKLPYRREVRWAVLWWDKQ